MRRPPRSRSLCLPVLAAALGLAPAGSAVTIDWVTVDGPGNACDAQPQGCFGAVAEVYRIAKTEITNAQYAAFLNAVAKDDTHALYSTSMASAGAGFGGITRSGSPGSYGYEAVAGRESRSVNYVSFYDALRFANWLHNGQPTGAQDAGTTEDGAYTITAQGIADNAIARNAGAAFALASEDEWYKAAYHDASGAAYYDYPAATDTPTVCAAPAATGNTANCGSVAGINAAVGDLSDAGSYPGATGPSGTLDQGGNAWEWNEAVVDGTSRGLRGGSFAHHPSQLAASARSYTVPEAESSVMGFRVVSLPEPGMGPMLIAGGLGLVGLLRRRQRRIGALAVSTLLCSLPAAGYEVPEDALLDSRRGGSFVWDYCYGKPDATPLPPDPRALVQPGANAGKAVHMNAYWKNCHVDPEAVDEVGAAETCGELRARFQRGHRLLDPGSPGVGGLFTGTTPGSRTSTFSADQFNQVWRAWGLLERPDNFDELVAERYGSDFSTSPNPYPRPGEDPNQTGGGTGRLPEMLTQMRNADGSWSGEITVTCHACHSGSVGTPQDGPGLGIAWGGGSSLADLNLLLRDMLPLGWEASLASVLNLNRTRGRNNASLVNLAFAFAGFHAPDIMVGILTSGSTADMDTPAWWNMGHRPVKFVDGVFPMDAPRVDAVFYAPNLGTTPQSQEWMRVNGPDMNAWIETLKAPEYPFPVDTALAEEGAELFHTLDLWAPERGNPIPRPAGNGSCASCHGAYAPRYVHDPSFLDTPELEGIASYIVPLDVIGTDPERVLTNNEEVQQAGATSFFGYPSTAGTEQDCGPQNRAEIRGDREVGYLAPPLYGVWASAPYLHNGSVPNVWELLKPEDRVPLWRRVSRPARPDQEGRTVMGFDTDLARAYDTEKLGWRYDAIACDATGGDLSAVPNVNCDPEESGDDPLAQQILDVLYSNLLLAWNILYVPPLTEAQMEDRKIHNSYMFGQGNEGHEFNAVLSDDERRAILEYLKTL